MAQHKGSPILGQTWGGTLFFAGFAAILAVMYAWWSDIVREAEIEGHHTAVVQLHHRYGMILFILSEVMFFVAWFWAFFNSSIFPDDIWQVTRTELFQGVWPPKGIEVLSPWKLPLLNTLILLTSGATLTWRWTVSTFRPPRSAIRATAGSASSSRACSACTVSRMTTMSR